MSATLSVDVLQRDAEERLAGALRDAAEAWGALELVPRWARQGIRLPARIGGVRVAYADAAPDEGAVILLWRGRGGLDVRRQGRHEVASPPSPAEVDRIVHALRAWTAWCRARVEGVERAVQHDHRARVERAEAAQALAALAGGPP